MGQEPRPPYSGSWLGLLILICTIAASQSPHAMEQPRTVLLPSTSSGTALMVTKRGEGTTMPSADISTFREDTYAIANRINNSECCGFHPLQTRLRERRQRYVALSSMLAGNNFLETRSSHTYILCILTRMVTPPCFPNYNINISTFPYLRAPLISNNF